MIKIHKDRVKSVLHIATAAASVVAGGCLMAACWGIYHAGEGFSRKAVGAAFSPISLTVYICLGLILAGWLVQLFLPDNKKRQSGKQIAYTLQRLQKSKDVDACGPTLQQDILVQRKKRLLHKAITLGLSVIGFAVFLYSALQPDAFHPTEINRSVIVAMQILLPCMIVPFAYAVYAAAFCLRSMEAEIAMLKLAPAKQNQVEETASKCNCILVARIALLCIAVTLLVYGFATGGIADVLTKAINICTECVGLG